MPHRALTSINVRAKFFVSSLLLVGLFTYSGSVSAVKNGDKCRIIGAKQVFKGVSYECRKNAKGIKVWKSVKKPVATPTTIAQGTTTTIARGTTTTIARGTTTTIARGTTTTIARGDRQGPVLVSGSVTPSGGDVSSSSVTFNVLVRITDATGVANSPYTRVNGPAGLSTSTLMTRVSGDTKDGSYSASLVIPQGRPSGNYYISVSMPADTIGNTSGSDGDWSSGPIPITSSP